MINGPGKAAEVDRVHAGFSCLILLTTNHTIRLAYFSSFF